MSGNGHMTVVPNGYTNTWPFCVVFFPQSLTSRPTTTRIAMSYTTASQVTDALLHFDQLARQPVHSNTVREFMDVNGDEIVSGSQFLRVQIEINWLSEEVIQPGDRWRDRTRHRPRSPSIPSYIFEGTSGASRSRRFPEEACQKNAQIR